MLTTDKFSCLILIARLVENGITEAVVSPGSRNTPLILALDACPDINVTMVVDERSAAFIALGKASVSGRPVALVCTSGTAVLNYAPAIAEAYYRQVPLLVISADRPREWIDQDDSQTLRQFEALSHYVKRSYDIPDNCSSDNARWYVNRVINDAILQAVDGRRAPVHINIQFDEPLSRVAPADMSSRWISRAIHAVSPDVIVPPADLADLADCIRSTPKVVVIAGFMPPDSVLSDALGCLASLPNVVVLTETVSNLRNSLFVPCIDAALLMLDHDKRRSMSPDLVITLGGALVSRLVKQWLRSSLPSAHWHVGVTDLVIDCLKSLTLKIDMPPAAFFKQLSEVIDKPVAESDYAVNWRSVHASACERTAAYAASAPWSDMKALDYIYSSVPYDWNLQLSNGTPIRYAQLFADRLVCHRCDCNRGVSGIDGSTSTAIGASTVYEGNTLLISGDMSCQYDVGAFAATCADSRFKMVVMCNGGGGIFRFISSTASLPQRDAYFALDRQLPLRQLAEGYGWDYYEASGIESLKGVWHTFVASSRRAILAVQTPPELSAEVLRGYFSI